MRFLTEFELFQQGITFSPVQSTLVIDGLTYTKGEAFPESSKDLVAKLCSSYEADGYQCLVLSAHQILTIWRALPPSPQTAESPPLSPEQPVLDQPTPTKPQIIYRGAVVEQSTPSNPESPPAPPSKTKKRTYRGVEY